jgi:hypothetical protein
MAHEFLETHQNDFEFNNTCAHQMKSTSAITSIFRHFEECPAVASLHEILMGDKLTAEMLRLNIQLPSQGKFSEPFELHPSSL